MRVFMYHMQEVHLSYLSTEQLHHTSVSGLDMCHQDSGCSSSHRNLIKHDQENITWLLDIINKKVVCIGCWWMFRVNQKNVLSVTWLPTPIFCVLFFFKLFFRSYIQFTCFFLYQLVYFLEFAIHWTRIIKAFTCTNIIQFHIVTHCNTFIWISPISHLWKGGPISLFVGPR